MNIHNDSQQRNDIGHDCSHSHDHTHSHNISQIINAQHSFFQYQPTKDIAFRLKALKKFKRLIINHQQDIIHALKQDLNKSELDTYTTEIGFLIQEINHIVKNLKNWAAPKKLRTAITHLGSKSYVYSEPYGVVLIIAPWNYPFQLAIAPLLGAMAAGNCAIIKPSELTPNTSKLLARIINDNFPIEYLYVAEGGVEVSTALLQEKFDYIFFTGSKHVGKIVMEAAAKELTPVTLELGGKSPCIVHHDADIELAAKRIVWGKFLNAGQTCIAPDYLLVHTGIKEKLLPRLCYYIKQFYGEAPLNNENFTKIVTEKHFNRLTNFIEQRNCLIGGNSDRKLLRIEPTILTDIKWEDKVMEDEIFGPILPVLTYEDISEDAIKLINNRPKPLALYLFSESDKIHNEILKCVSFGGGCINDTVYHVASPYLPFGGIGASGIGAYHGVHSFETFSHKKSILKQTTTFDLPLRYPNYKGALKKLKLFLRI